MISLLRDSTRWVKYDKNKKWKLINIYKVDIIKNYIINYNNPLRLKKIYKKILFIKFILYKLYKEIWGMIYLIIYCQPQYYHKSDKHINQSIFKK